MVELIPVWLGHVVGVRWTKRVSHTNHMFIARFTHGCLVKPVWDMKINMCKKNGGVNPSFHGERWWGVRRGSRSGEYHTCHWVWWVGTLLILFGTSHKMVEQKTVELDPVWGSMWRGKRVEKGVFGWSGIAFVEFLLGPPKEGYFIYLFNETIKRNRFGLVALAQSRLLAGLSLRSRHNHKPHLYSPFIIWLYKFYSFNNFIHSKKEKKIFQHQKMRILRSIRYFRNAKIFHCEMVFKIRVSCILNNDI